MEPPRIYLSYTQADSEFGSRLCNDLTALGMSVKLASSDLDSAALQPNDMTIRVYDRLQHFDTYVLVFSPDASRSRRIEREMYVAQARANNSQMRRPILVAARPFAFHEAPSSWTQYCTARPAFQDYAGAVQDIRWILAPPFTPSLAVSKVGVKDPNASSLRSAIKYVTIAMWLVAFLTSCTFATAITGSGCDPYSVTGCSPQAVNGGQIAFGLLFFAVYFLLAATGIIMTLIKTGQQGRWGWFVAVWLLGPFAVTAYSVAGPDD
jgi:hypothetical protein